MLFAENDTIDFSHVQKGAMAMDIVYFMLCMLGGLFIIFTFWASFLPMMRLDPQTGENKVEGDEQFHKT